ncbi:MULTISPECIES: DUF3558 domain-containing protein [Actinoalloteichus]|uniref:DUF3558 domain-containing protein n=1 Tax=Actinoalloteichus caeruleus DSM 43889 TaxID=1120930 RepID=A0ABT1JJF9_ACTCY|nr:DUF3558 domain-containing protein [Actinoalloteichus caeruleus]MCP2332645.1 Protein of unknown function (DUF3558) [Actinoalloteichus caeruleus DSM 43889]
MRRRGVGVWGTALGLVGLLSACASAEQGTAVAVEPTVGSSLPGSADPSVGGSPGEQPGVDVAAELSEMLPCEILSDEEVDDLGFDPESASFDDVGLSYACDYRPPGGGRPPMSIQLNWQRSVDQLDLTNYSVEEKSVGPLRALRIVSGADSQHCQVSVALSSEAHVSIFVHYGGTTEQACATAESVAAAVEPKLPRSSG